MYKGIEGLRAWLAWTVVFSHIAEGADLTVKIPKAELIFGLGDSAVRVFIIISGFVITHLIIEKEERFATYIIRRFLRIYPAYIVALLLAILIAGISYEAVLESSGASASLASHLISEQEQFQKNFVTHLLAHVTLLHGMIPNNILPESQYMFLGPAWSLSLEWQFYLIAPIWILALQRSPFLAVGASLIAAIGYKALLSGMFFNPSFLPGACLWFLLGIATRFWLPSAPQLKEYPFTIVLGSFGLVVLDKQLLPLFVWIATVAYVMQYEKWRVLDSRVARAAGMRSYAVYIMHAPVLTLAFFAAAKCFQLSGLPLIMTSAGISVLGTIILSEIVHRWIEIPAIDFGKGLGRKAA